MFNLCWYKREWRNTPREGTSVLPSSTVAWPPVKEGSQGALPEWGSCASQHFTGVGWGGSTPDIAHCEGLSQALLTF